MLYDVSVGDIVVLRKTHPCGGTEWRVMRIGADIGLQCIKCGRRIMLTRREFNKSVKRFVSQAAGPSADTGASGTDEPH